MQDENNKHTPTPWYKMSETKKGFHYIFANEDIGRPIKIVSMEYGSHPVKEQLEEWEANAEFIVTACNSYHGLKQQNEEYVKYLSERAFVLEETIKRFPNERQSYFDKKELDKINELLTKHKLQWNL